MKDTVPPPARSSRWNSRWVVVCLPLIGFAVSWMVLSVVQPSAAADSGTVTGLAILWLAALALSGVGTAVIRRDFWRVTSSGMNILLTAGLLALGIVAVVGFVGLALVALMAIRGGGH